MNVTLKAHLRAGCMAIAAVGLVATASPIQAQARTDTASTYNLPAQPLAETLRSIARLSGRDILFADDAVRDHAAPALHGALTADQAVGTALAGSGLTAENRDGAILVRPRSTAGDVLAAAMPADEVTVTGTRIRGTDSPSPLIVATRQSIEQAGLSTVTDFARTLPQNFSGGQNPGVAGGGEQGGYNNINNAATFNLRGLGSDATLTLINGHRLAYDAVDQGIDVATIPVAALDRVEVIPDGASALYGSDAVGGVVNLVLRRDFSGAQLSARYGASTDGGNVQQQYDAVTGARWTSGGFMVAGDYLQSTPIYAADRPYTRNLNGSQTLLDRQRQGSVVLAGHQQLAPGVTLDLDGEFADRHAYKANAFTTDTPATENGLVNSPRVRSLALSPTLRADLPGGWVATLGGTRSISRTEISTNNYDTGVDTPGRVLYDNHLSNVEAGAEGPLLELPGGAMRLAVGGGYRTFSLYLNTSQTVGGVTSVTGDANQKRQSVFAYGELSLPLVSTANSMPFVEELRVSAAGRYERYRGIDAVGTPKLGLIYAPIQDVRFKFSWGRSFKIPTLNQIAEVQQGVLLPASIFAPQPAPALPANSTVLLIAGGNAGLSAERATTWSGTVELQPHGIAGLRFAASWFDVNYRDRIGVPITGLLSSLTQPGLGQLVQLSPTAAQVTAAVAGLPQALSNQSGQPFDPANVGAIVDDRLRNAAHQHAHGLDLMAEYRTDLGSDEQLLLTASGSYLNGNRQVNEGQPFLPQAGIIFTPPHWRFRTGAVYARATVELSGFVNYLGGETDNRFPTPVRLSPFTTVDLSARVQTATTGGLFHGVEVRLSAINLLDKKPEQIANSDPTEISYDSTNQSAIGRFVSLALTKRW